MRTTGTREHGSTEGTETRKKMEMQSVCRCQWCLGDPLYVDYHDQEWGVPVHDDRRLFEFLILEGAQAGLSWLTVLKKRQHYRTVFDDFDPYKVARYSAAKVQALLSDPGIIRNRRKIEAAIQNAQAFLAIQQTHGSFDTYIWKFVEHKSIQNTFTTLDHVPAKTTVSDAMSKELKKNGFSFVGSTICYAFMQAIGMVNDHVINCFRYKEVAR